MRALIAFVLAIPAACVERPPISTVSQQLIAQCGAGLKYSSGFTAGIENRFGGKALTMGVESEIKAAFLSTFSAADAAKQYGPYTDCITGKASVRATILAIGERIDRMRIQLQELKVSPAVVQKLVSMAHDEQDAFERNEFLEARTIRADMTQLIVKATTEAGSNTNAVCFACMSVPSADASTSWVSQQDVKENAEMVRQRRNTMCSIMSAETDLEGCSISKEAALQGQLNQLIKEGANKWGVTPEDANRIIEEQLGTLN